ncbi:MAG: twin-arginine translocation signal domain-containing protein, partial [Verrucomicrobia bacterium]|nr:twin-arginine translocation signal domain-containing protein [Verrucomicrobiota bacterium]
MINDDTKTQLSRRAFLGESGIGLGALAATSLLSEASAGQSG